jgi:hypothetical protein
MWTYSALFLAIIGFALLFVYCLCRAGRDR